MNTVMPSDVPERLNAALAGRYAIERELGSGAMATVYLADDLKHRRKVAVKVLRPQLAAAIGPDRFLREIEIAASLSHPHILALHDSGEKDGFLFYVMPFVRGESLRARLDREKQLPIEDALEITRQVAAALHHAHGRSVIHRDIKPENILLFEGEAVVADFGIALAMTGASGGRLTETGVMVGTPLYMSPEQTLGDQPVDARSDVYSLACVLYELLAGEAPYTGATAQAILAKRLTDPVPAVRRIRPVVPVAVEQALVRALSGVAADRFPTASAFAEALTAPVETRQRPPTVAVLPFRNMNPDPESEFFADGITEDVIAHLSKVRALEVISRMSVMPFKQRQQSLREIGGRLAVSTLLEGSVRRVGDRVRIVAQLVDAATEQNLWAETYDRQLSDIFAIQTDVALHIAEALKAKLSPDEKSRIRKEPTSDLEAYQLHLKARHHLIRYTEAGLQRAIAYSTKAIQKDPDFALAYVGLGLAYSELARGQGGEGMRPVEAFRRAREAASRALELDGKLGEAHSLLAFVRFACDYDWTGAEEEFRRALELNPGSADVCDFYGQMLADLRRFDEALAMVRRAQQLDPLAHRSDVGTVLLRAGRIDEAMRVANALLEFDPRDARGHAILGWASLRKGLVDKGVAELEEAVSCAPGNTMFLAQLGQAYGEAGRTDQARDILRQLEELARERAVRPYYLAYVLTGLGEHDAAIDQLEQAAEERGGAQAVNGSFLFAALRSHPRFSGLLHKVNLA